MTQIINLRSPTITNYDDLATQPPQILKQLKIHQLASLQRMIFIERRESVTCDGSICEMVSNIGFLADLPGSGKSLTILALIASNKGVPYIDFSSQRTTVIDDYCKFKELTISPQLRNYFDTLGIPIIFTRNYMENIKSLIIIYDCSVIIVPHFIVSQWETYIKNETHGLTYYVIKKRQHIPNTKKDFIEKIVKKHDIILISCTMLKLISTIIGNMNDIIFSRKIIDEIDSIKVPFPLSHIVSAFTWLVSASYNEFNLTSTMYKLLVKIPITKEIFNKNYVIVNDVEKIKGFMNLPGYKVFICTIKSNDTARIFRGLVDDNVIESINADNIPQAIAMLNMFNCSENDIIETLSENLVIQHTNLLTKKIAKENTIYQNENSKKEALEVIDKQIKEVENKIKTLKERIKERDECPICYAEIENRTLLKCCQKSVCLRCISSWLINHVTCPYCTNNINKDFLIYIKEDDEDPLDISTKKIIPITWEQQIKECSKKVDCIRIIMTLKHLPPIRKFLIFSNHDGTFDVIKELLVELRINYRMLLGSGTTTGNIVKNFKESRNSEALLLNARFCGAGINLTEATDIIIYHRVADELKQQLIARGYRVGRNPSVELRVWEIYYGDEY